MDTVSGWQYKTVSTNDLSATTLVEQLNHEGAAGWQLVTIQPVALQVPQDEETLPGLVNRNLTGDYLLIFTKPLGS